MMELACVILTWRHVAFGALTTVDALPMMSNPRGIHGVSGTRFSGLPIREAPEMHYRKLKRSDLRWMRNQKKCDKWIVVTTIYQPSAATRRLGELTRLGWCFVVVGDVTGPDEYDDVQGVVYLNAELQRGLHYHILEHIPWRHFGRKNLGYLYAIQHGAKVIYDTDDDNRLKELGIPIFNGTTDAQQPVLASWAPPFFNPYAHFNSTCKEIWPRGYPLDHVQRLRNEFHEEQSAILAHPPVVQQFLADEDPDVDAVYRLTRPLPCRFGSKDKVLVVPPEVFAPYNAQATVHLYEAFWALLLPVTVNGRVSDIWRAYMSAKLIWAINRQVAFTSAYVVHDRVQHDYLKDFQSEQDLYLMTPALLNFLKDWKSDAPTLIERIEQLWGEVYRRGFIELGDFHLLQAWIKDLRAVGYDFPDLEIPKIMWAHSEL
eukprot:GEMP01037895.1.p1 GENE.GEMP01037895.1~~GEMP01037895.1.p1  ORF type:complete len:430 (+),score=85.56 GEMP01037895.1:129-1418(+)